MKNMGTNRCPYIHEQDRMVQNREKHSKNSHFPISSGMSERSGVHERSKQCGMSERVSGVNQ